MPFTLSHAAAALPFRKLKPVWPALVIGTFAPDLQYFILLSDEDRSGHHFPGVFLLTLPLALLVLWLFERCVKESVVELLPVALQRRLHDKIQPLSFWGWGQFASIVLWIVVGIATHVLWDQFTHGHTWITTHLGLLYQTVPVPFHSPMAVFKVLQHASTVFGLLALVAWFAMWYCKTKPARSAELRQLSSFRKFTVVFTMAVIAVVAGYPLAMLRLAGNELPVNRVFFIVTVFVAITLVFCTLLLLYGLGRTIRAPIRRVPATRLDDNAARSR